METLLIDVRYALAMMRRNAAFTAAGLLTFALGIGAITAVFSIVYGVLLRPLPYPDAERLVRLSEEHPGAVSPLRSPMLSNLTFYAWSDHARTIEQIAGYTPRQYTISLPGGAERIDGAAVTPALWPLIGERPLLGRFFRDEEAVDGADAVVVLSERAWRERFSGDPSMVGRGVDIDGTPHAIIGVARAGFSFPAHDTQLWLPLVVRRPSPDAVAGRPGPPGSMSVMFALARLRPDVSAEQAAAEGTAAARTTVRPMAANLLFGVGGPPVVHVRGMVDEMTSTIRPALLVVAAAVVCVLLIACANVANLFLSRGVARQRELAIRGAIGASQLRLARQLLTESLVLSIGGGLLGLSLAWALVRMMPSVAAADFPRITEVTIDARVIAFTALATLVTAVLSGVAPALRGAGFDLAESLHGGDGASAGGFRGARATRLRNVLLAAEAAFAVMLLVAAMLFARSFVRLIRVDAGYTAAHVLTAQIFVPGGDREEQAGSMNRLVAALLDRVRALPDVQAAGAANMMPLDGATAIAGFPAPWQPPGAARTTARALAYIVMPGYAEAIGLRLRAGRLFRDTDLHGAITPFIVNEEFARLYLPPNPIGYQFVFPATADAPERRNEIIGVVANVLKNGNDTAPQPEHYALPRQPVRFSGRFELAIRTRDNPAAAAPYVRAAVRELSPNAAVELLPLSDRFAKSVAQPRFAMTVLAGFAALALALACVGLYGVLSYSVSQRRRELGVRAALGAARVDLVALVVREGLGVTVVGLGIGLLGAALVTRFMQSVLFGVTPLDAASFASAPALLVPVALAACVLPARRAATVDPAEALRRE
jgi:putative ABC transport system permease protein